MPLRLQNFFASLIIIFFAFLLIFRNAYHASHIETFPDAVEYVSMAINYLNQGTFQIDVNGQFYPSRYAPWFSLTVLTPALIFFGIEAGNAIYGVLFVNILGMLLGYLLLSRVLPPLAALAGTLALFLIPDFTRNAQFIMNDAPSALVFLICFYVFLKNQKLVWNNRLEVILIGSLIALATLWRITNIFLILPFLFLMDQDFRKKLSAKLLFLTPLAFALVLNFCENYLMFGSFFRNGYNYWTSIPYDYPSLTFNWSNLITNLAKLSENQSYLVIVGVFLASLIVHYLKGRDAIKPLLSFLLLVAMPVLIFYLLYFYFDYRFFLPVILVMFGSIVWTLRYYPPIIHKLILLAILVGIYLQMNTIALRHEFPLYRKNIDSLKLNTELGSTVLTNINLPYLKLYFPNLERKFIPISRRAEYASKVIMTRKNEDLLVSEIKDPFQHRHPKLLAMGIDPIGYTFLEDPKKLLKDLPDQKIYLDLYSFPEMIAQDYYQQVSKYCDLVMVSPGIFRLQIRN